MAHHYTHLVWSQCTHALDILYEMAHNSSTLEVDNMISRVFRMTDEEIVRFSTVRNIHGQRIIKLSTITQMEHDHIERQQAEADLPSEAGSFEESQQVACGRLEIFTEM
jgi:hypothetical protein